MLQLRLISLLPDIKVKIWFQIAGGMGRDDADRFGAPARGQIEAQPVWDMESADYECDCPGPPPPFQVPPPPRPPFLLDADCSELPLSDLETCEAVPVSITVRTGIIQFFFSSSLRPILI